jgi:dual specificity MAP kinase phosphatase
VEYLSLHLKDHVREDIASVFYEAIEFMIQAVAEGGRLFVHCVQGISRSATICLAYMIFTQKRSYVECFKDLKERRMCANPNMTFIAQLVWF